MRFANRMDRFGEGVFSMLAQMKKKKLAEGEAIVDLSIGAPNIAPAPHILKALSEACLVPDNYLYAIQDQQALLEAVSEWYARRYGVELNPETEICSLLGSQEGLAHIALSIVDEGDVVLVPDPCYPVFADGPSLAGAELYYMPQREENHYIIDLKEIPEEVAQKAKFMIVSYPNNPTAVLAPDSFYEELIAFAKKYDIIVLHDNAYSELVFDGRTCGSFLRFPGAREVGVEFNSLSKTYGLAGARVGFCVGNEEVVSHLKTLKSTWTMVCSCRFRKRRSRRSAVTRAVWLRRGRHMRDGATVCATDLHPSAGRWKNRKARCLCGRRSRQDLQIHWSL